MNDSSQKILFWFLVFVMILLGIGAFIAFLFGTMLMLGTALSSKGMTLGNSFASIGVLFGGGLGAIISFILTLVTYLLRKKPILKQLWKYALALLIAYGVAMIEIGLMYFFHELRR